MNSNIPKRKGAYANFDKLHLGCGRNTLDGWLNIDLIRHPGVLRHDLKKPLPISSSTVRFIFSEHFLEHLMLDEAVRHLKDCHRVLTEGGILRISTPDLRKLVEEYLSGRLNEWIDVGWKPKTPCRLMNEGMRLWEHQYIYDFDDLAKIILECGFSEITRCHWKKSNHIELVNVEQRPFHGELIVEAKKNAKLR